MDSAFELGKKLNHLAMSAFLKRLDHKTGLVYFDETDPFNFETKKAPLLENMSYVLCLFNQKSQESFAQAEKLLLKLLSYLHEGNFPKYFHEAPLQTSPYTGAYCYPYLFKMLANFGHFMGQSLKDKIAQALSDIKKALSSLKIYHHLEPLYEAMQSHQCSLNALGFENAFAVALSDPSKVKTLESHYLTAFFERGHLMLSLFDFIKAQDEGVYPPHLLDDHPLHLKLSLFYEPFEKRSYAELKLPSSYSPKAFVFYDEKKRQRLISTEDKASLTLFKEGFDLHAELALHESLGIYMPKEMTLHQFGKKGTYFLKNEPIIIEGLSHKFTLISSVNLAVAYDKRPQELFDETSLALKALSSGPLQIKFIKHA